MSINNSFSAHFQHVSGRKYVVDGLNHSIKSIEKFEDNISVLSELLELLDKVAYYYSHNFSDKTISSELDCEGISIILDKLCSESPNCLLGEHGSVVLKWGSMNSMHLVRYVPEHVSPTFAIKVFRPFAPIMNDFFEIMDKVSRDAGNFDTFYMAFVGLIKYFDSEDDIEWVIHLSLSSIGSEKISTLKWKHFHNFIILINHAATLNSNLKARSVYVLVSILSFWQCQEKRYQVDGDPVIPTRKIIQNCVELIWKLSKDKAKEVQAKFSDSEAIERMTDFCWDGGFTMAPRISCVYVEIMAYRPVMFCMTDFFLQSRHFELIIIFLSLGLTDEESSLNMNSFSTRSAKSSSSKAPDNLPVHKAIRARGLNPYDIDAEQISDCTKSSIKILLGLLTTPGIIDHDRLKKLLENRRLYKLLICQVTKQQQKRGIVRDIITAFLIMDKSCNVPYIMSRQEIEELLGAIIQRVQHIKRPLCRKEAAELILNMIARGRYNLTITEDQDLTFMDQYLIETLEKTSEKPTNKWIAAVDVSWRKTRNDNLFLDDPAAGVISEYTYARSPTKARIFKYIGDQVAEIFDRDPPCDSKDLKDLIKCLIEIKKSASGDEELFAFEDLVAPIMGLYNIATDKDVIKTIKHFISVIH